MLLSDLVNEPTDAAEAGRVPTAAAWRLWQQAERYCGGGTRSYSPYAADLDIATPYHPQRGEDAFTVPSVLVPHDRGRYLTGVAPSSLHTLYHDRDGFVLPVHPEARTVPALAAQLEGMAEGPRFEVAPSANARTVFVNACDGDPVPPHFVKLHYPKRLSRFTRRLRQPVLELHLWVAAQLDGIGAAVLPEVGAGVLGTDPAEAWGFLLREATPRTHPPASAPAPTFTVPLFALYGTDVRAPGHPTLLEQLIAAADDDPATWVSNHVIEPLVTLWAHSLLRTGCALEPHGQNALLRFTDDLRTTAVAYRDCAVYVDPALRQAQGLTGPLPPRNIISGDITSPRDQVFSLVYDSFLGHHTLDYLARLLRERYGVDSAVLHRHARKVFAEQVTVPDLLPDTVYYYDHQLHPDGDWHLVDTGVMPCWR